MPNQYESANFVEEIISPRELELAHTRAKTIVIKRIDPTKFTEYKDVDKDLEFVAKKKMEFQTTNARGSAESQFFDKFGEVFEAVITEQIEKNKWFGPNAVIIGTSEYDDIARKADAVVEFQEGQNRASHLALALDTTTSTHLNDKVRYIKDSIGSGKLTEIKYFQSKYLGFRGVLENVPHVVIGADKKTASDIIRLWLANNKAKLLEHPIKWKILEEMRIQLLQYKKYAEKIGKDNLVPIYNKALMTVETIINQNAPSQERLREMNDDEVFYLIKSNAEGINR